MNDYKTEKKKQDENNKDRQLQFLCFGLAYINQYT